MTRQGPTIKAKTFEAWYEQLEEIVAQDPDEVAPGNRQRAVMLLHDLIGLGVRLGAVRLLVSHSTGPRGFAHLSFRYPLHQEFDWNGDIVLTREPEHFTLQLEQLFAEVEAATGVSAMEDESDRQ